MDDYIEISTLNDFAFCPYSIYLHNVYYSVSEDIFQASPQLKGKISHASVDRGDAVRNTGDLSGIPVYSERYNLMGKIDVYKAAAAQLIERKQHIQSIYQGQIYQLWAQLICMQEMGYEVRSICFYEISSRKTIPVKMPSMEDIKNFEKFLTAYRSYHPDKDSSPVNKSKCLHCIYCNLCDKTEEDNVYA